MKKAALLLFCFSFITGCSSVKIMNLDHAKKLVRDYYENGEYDNDCERILNEAERKIGKIPLQENSTVVFDIDDTVLSNYEYTKQLGFGYNHTTYQEWVSQCKFKAIPKVKSFYEWLISKKIKVVFLTGRNSETYSGTKQNLFNEGFNKYDTLIVRNEKERNMSAVVYKSAKREELTKRGYKIIASIGDQASDLEGNYVGIKIKLPNYLYGIE